MLRRPVAFGGTRMALPGLGRRSSARIGLSRGSGGPSLLGSRRDRRLIVCSAGIGTCRFAKISSPRSFFPSGERSCHFAISARVRSAQSSTVWSRLTKKSSARARRYAWSWRAARPSRNSSLTPPEAQHHRRSVHGVAAADAVWRGAAWLGCGGGGRGVPKPRPRAIATQGRLVGWLREGRLAGGGWVGCETGCCDSVAAVCRRGAGD